MAEPADNSSERPSTDLSHLTGEGVIIDIGTGDGTFVYQCARRNPAKFVIGIDPSPRPLEKISERVHRRPAKGGLPNVLFLQAAVEDLPNELDGVADEIHVHFPWASLLRSVAVGDPDILGDLRRICAPGALLEVVLALDDERDRTELARLGVKSLDASYVQDVLATRYRAAGFEIKEFGRLPDAEWSKLHTTWARRLENSPNRKLTYLVAQAFGASKRSGLTA